jgi:organic radical activating enzyme
MARNSEEPQFLRNIGMVMTFKCQVACPHCVIGAGPNRKEEMRIEDLSSWIRQASAYRNGHILAVGLTGGEPFYNLQKLRTVVDLTVSNGMLPTAVTNAFWAESREKAMEVLNFLPGLHVISVSADAYHQAQIPFENVKNAVLAARELGRICEVAVCTEDERDSEYLNLLQRLRAFIEEDAISTNVTFPGGRALARMDTFRYQMTPEGPNAACGAASTPTIFPDGRVFACVGSVIDLHSAHPLLLGNLHDTPLAEILDAAERSAILHFLRLWGPGRLLALLKNEGCTAKLPVLFVKNGLCNLCYALMSDPDLCALMTKMLNERHILEKIAYARMFYFDEVEMVEDMHLIQEDSAASWADASSVFTQQSSRPSHRQDDHDDKSKEICYGYQGCKR